MPWQSTPLSIFTSVLLPFAISAGFFTGNLATAARLPPPPPPPPPLDAVIPPGDVCILYSGAGKVPTQLLRGITACACYTMCYGDEVCDWRKFCTASQRRSECQAAAAQAYNAGNPCPRWVGPSHKLFVGCIPLLTYAAITDFRLYMSTP